MKLGNNKRACGILRILEKNLMYAQLNFKIIKFYLMKLANNF
jgi:hypothetical protein